MPMERLQKVLARAGVGARRSCEDLIIEGRVRVNGKVQRELGSRVDPQVDRIEVDGVLIELPAEQHFHYFALHKPPYVVSTVSDPEGRRTVRDLIEVDARIFPVGRLDYDSEGLLLMTDDGDLTYRLTHPSFEVDKEYRVLLDRTPNLEELRRWRDGVELEPNIVTAPAWVEVLETVPDGTWVRVVLHEGRNRQIKRVAEILGMGVLRLVRMREGPVTLGDLKPGEWRALNDKEVKVLRAHAAKIPLEQRERGAPRRDDEQGERSDNAPGAWRRVAPRLARIDEPQAPERAAGPRREDGPRVGAFRGGPRRDEDQGPRRDEGPRDGGFRGGPRQDDGPRGGGPLRRGAPTRQGFRGGPRQDEGEQRRDDGPRGGFRGGPRRDDGPRAGGFRGGPRRDDDRGPRRDDGPRDGGFRGGPRRDEGRGGPPNRQGFRPGPRRDEGPQGGFRGGPRRDEGPQGGFRGGPRRAEGEGRGGPPSRGGPPNRQGFRPGPRRDDGPRDGGFRGGPRRDEGEGPRRDDGPRGGGFRGGPRRDEGAGPRRDAGPQGGFRGGPRRDDDRGPRRDEGPRDGGFRGGPRREQHGEQRRGPRDDTRQAGERQEGANARGPLRQRGGPRANAAPRERTQERDEGRPEGRPARPERPPRESRSQAQPDERGANSRPAPRTDGEREQRSKPWMRAGRRAVIGRARTGSSRRRESGDDE